MVDHVIDHHTAQNGYARHRKYGLAAIEEGPRRHQLRVAGSADTGRGRSHTLVEHFEKLGSRTRDLGSVRRRARRRKIQRFSFESGRNPFGQLRDVGGQPAQRHRFFVRLPTELVLGNALQRFAGIRHFMIELG